MNYASYKKQFFHVSEYKKVVDVMLLIKGDLFSFLHTTSR
jgi:hypothetical protein